MNKQDEQWWKDMCSVFTECRKDHEKRVIFLKLASNMQAIHDNDVEASLYMQSIATEIGKDR